MTGFELSNGVGRGDANRPEDVRRLKQRLVDLGFSGLTVDEQMTDDLKETIDLVQSIKAGRTHVDGDRSVDVPGPTYKWLRAWNAPRWVELVPGTRAAGFAVRGTGGPTYGTEALRRTLHDAGVRYRDTHAEDFGTAPITVETIAGKPGESVTDHGGHATGLAFDILLPSTDGTADPDLTYRDHGYDRRTTWAMLRAIKAQPLVTKIEFDDPELADENLCSQTGGFEDRAHVEIAPIMPEVGYDRPVNELYDQAIDYFGGTRVDPTRYPVTQEGFGEYIHDVGVEHFDADEMLSPNEPDDAAAVGMDILLPPHRWWPRGAALGLLSDKIRERVGSAVWMRNWFRPRPYNDRVASADLSDHITASSVDLDYSSAADRRTAEEFLNELDDADRWLQLSLGLGNVSIHVGMLSLRHRRRWHYDSYPD